MTIESVSNIIKRSGNIGETDDNPCIASAIQELQGLKRTIVTGFAGDASVALTGASAARGDTLITVVVACSALGPVQLTLASCSISNGRIVVADTSSAGKMLDVLWWNKGGF